MSLPTPPIDVVYTWVDPNRPGFAGDLAGVMQSYHRAAGVPPSHRATGPNRFADHECLRYSLRSVRQYAPWINKIYLVTAGEHPSWLDTSHPAIQLVRHDEIFPNLKSLPTFNSNAIETCLYRIPGLSQRFLYFNDDIFITRPLDLAYFQSPTGEPHFRFEPRTLPLGANGPSPVGASGDYSRQLLDKRFGGQSIRMDTPHEPVLFDRTLLETMVRDWPIEVTQTRKNQLRAYRDFCTIRIFIHCQLEHALARPGRGLKLLKIRPTKAGFVRFGVQHPSLKAQLRKASRSMPPFLCINDETGEGDTISPAQSQQDSQLLAQFLAQRFPNPAPWEISPPQPPQTAALAWLNSPPSPLRHTETLWRALRTLWWIIILQIRPRIGAWGRKMDR
jgi:hypothetical protein